jgi:hypothetical protein
MRREIGEYVLKMDGEERGDCSDLIKREDCIVLNDLVSGFWITLIGEMMIGLKGPPEDERMIFEVIQMIMKRKEQMKGDFGIEEKFEGNGLFLQSRYSAFLFPTFRQSFLRFENRERFGFILSFLLPHHPWILQASASYSLCSIMSYGESECVKWVAKEGSVRGVIRNVREKKSRRTEVILSGVITLLNFLNPKEEGMRREEKDWREGEDLRELMWRMEEEGSVDSIILFKPRYERASKELKCEGICVGGEDGE